MPEKHSPIVSVATCADNDSGWLKLDDEYGAPIFDHVNHRVAVLKYLLCNPQTEQPRYAILSCDGFLGPGEDCRPVPAILLNRAAETLGFVLSVERQIFLDGPRHLDKDDKNEEDWIAAVDTYYAELTIEAAAVHRPQLVRG